MLGPFLLAHVLGFGCTTTTIVGTPSCELVVEGVEPASAAPGESVVITASPLTTDFDTTVQLGDQTATIDEVLREGCDVCDECRETNECSGCSDCSACDLTCEQSCVETVVFTVPALDSGPTSLLLINSHGVSEVQSFEVGSSDTGVADDTGGGADDTGGSADDTGTAGGDDTGSGDTGAAAASSSLAQPSPLPPGPWREGTLASELTCAIGPASAMSPR